MVKSEGVTRKVSGQPHIYGIAQLLISLLLLYVRMEVFGEVLKTRTLSWCKKSSSWSYDGRLHNGNQSREIGIDLDPYTRRSQLEYLIPYVRMFSLSCLPLQLGLGSKKQWVLTRTYQPVIYEVAIVGIEVVVLQYKVLFPRRILRQVLSLIKVAKPIGPNRESRQPFHADTLKKLVPKVNKSFHLR